jgi:hypothetical protein
MSELVSAIALPLRRTIFGLFRYYDMVPASALIPAKELRRRGASVRLP